MARKKTVKKYSLAEFKAWLEGVEEIQPNDWVPDANQWKMIREKIGAIVEAPPPPPANQGGGRVAGNGPPLVRQPVQPQRPFIPPDSSLAVTGDIPNPMTGGEPDISPAAKAALAGKLPTEIATDPSKGSKTPNIDTMNGNYESNFT